MWVGIKLNVPSQTVNYCFNLTKLMSPWFCRLCNLVLPQDSSTVIYLLLLVALLYYTVLPMEYKELNRWYFSRYRGGSCRSLRHCGHQVPRPERRYKLRDQPIQRGEHNQQQPSDREHVSQWPEHQVHRVRSVPRRNARGGQHSSVAHVLRASGEV